MKLIKFIVLSLFLIGFNISTNAQFWKKLKKKAQEKISNAEDKLIDKLENETTKTIEGTINGEKVDKSIETSSEIPKFSGGLSVLYLLDNGYEYASNEFKVSTYGKFTKENLSNSVKTYNEGEIRKPVDTYRPGFVLIYNKGGFLKPKGSQIIIHHADSTKIVLSLKGTWEKADGNLPVNATFVNLNVLEIIDKRKSINSHSNSKKEDTLRKTQNINNTEKTATNIKDNIELPNTYFFDKSLEILITTNKTESIEMELLFGNNRKIYAMSIGSKQMDEQGTVYNVFTPNKTTMFMDMPGMKIKKPVSVLQITATNYSDKMPENSNSIKKTGATKSILGYNCEEYTYQYNDGHTSAWVTKDFPIKNENLSILGMGKNNVFAGFVLELHMKTRNETIVVKAVKYNMNKSVTINTSDYKLMGF